MPKFGKCWNEQCLLYGQMQPVEDQNQPVCSECKQLLTAEPGELLMPEVPSER